jgi:hypothetical protein
MRIAAIFLTALILAACASVVPLSSAIEGAIPRGEKIRVRGFVSLEFEGQSIYESTAACEAGNTSRALWVDIPRNDVPEGWRDCAYAEISGEFHPDDTGHFGMWPSGAVTSIWRIRALRQ